MLSIGNFLIQVYSKKSAAAAGKPECLPNKRPRSPLETFADTPDDQAAADKRYYIILYTDFIHNLTLELKKMHYFFYEGLKNTAIEECIKLNKDEAEHLFKILRAAPGDQIRLLDGCGTVADATVIPGKMLQIQNMTLFPMPSLRIHVYVAAPRRQKMEQLLKQAAELGAWRIVPIQCERSVALPSGERIAKRGPDLLMEACKQSGNAYLPQLEDPIKCMDAIADAKAKCQKVFFGDPGTSGEPGSLTGDIGYFIGPEGGFSPTEADAIRQAGFLPIRIGHWILRVETAVTAGLAVLNFLEENTLH